VLVFDKYQFPPYAGSTRRISPFNRPRLVSIFSSSGELLGVKLQPQNTCKSVSARDLGTQHTLLRPAKKKLHCNHTDNSNRACYSCIYLNEEQNRTPLELNSLGQYLHYRAPFLGNFDARMPRAFERQYGLRGKSSQTREDLPATSCKLQILR